MPLPPVGPRRGDAGNASRRRRRYRVWLWVLAAVGGVVAVFGAGVPLAMQLHWAAEDRRAEDRRAGERRAREQREDEEREGLKRKWEATAPAGARWEYTRAEFEEVVVGKTLWEVRAVLGPPDERDGGWNNFVWVYRYRTTDPLTGRPDRMAVVGCGQDRAYRVSFQ